MYKVKVMNTCSCFLKSGLPEVSEFTTENEAKQEAEEMTQRMNTRFCHKHEFALSEKFGDYTISMKMRS